MREGVRGELVERGVNPSGVSHQSRINLTAPEAPDHVFDFAAPLPGFLPEAPLLVLPCIVKAELHSRDLEISFLGVVTVDVCACRRRSKGACGIGSGCLLWCFSAPAGRSTVSC